MIASCCINYRANRRSLIAGNQGQADDSQENSPPGKGASRFRLPLRRFAIRGVKGAAFVLVLEYLVLPQLAGARKSLSVLAGVNFAWVGAGIALEILALIAYARLTESLLPDATASLWKIFRIDLVSLAFSHVIPAGTAGGTGVSMRLFTNAGVRATDAGFAIALQGIGSAVVLNLILWIALLVSIPLRGFNAIYAVAAGLGVFVFALFGALLILFTKGEERVANLLDKVATKLRFIPRDRVLEILSRIAHRIADLESNPELLKKAIVFASANWLLDAASLWVFMAAFGHYVDPDALLVSYGLANVMAAIPITPGGLGVVEGVLTSTLVGFGSPRAVAILGVIAYRLINFWLPIPTGGLFYLSLDRKQGGKRGREILRNLLPRERTEGDPPSQKDQRLVRLRLRLAEALRLQRLRVDINSTETRG